MSRAAAWLAFAISAIYAAQGLFLLFIGYDPSRLIDRTGVDWDEFVSAYPAVAEDLALKHNERLFSVTLLALALLASAVIAPQPLNSAAKRRCFPWSEGFDRIFRNEGVTGSNPVSSTTTN